MKGIGKYVYDLYRCARMAVDETGIGVYEDKILKRSWRGSSGQKGRRGIAWREPDANMVFVAKPMGVVAAAPSPIRGDPNVQRHVCRENWKCRDLASIQRRSTELLTREFMNVVNGGPDDLIQTVKDGTIETTQELMKIVDVVVATGGAAMVKSAYSSGKPSFGVGAGNVPVIVDSDVDLNDATTKIVNGASFDNGIICSHEQFVLVPEAQYRLALESFEATGKLWFTEDETLVQKFRDIVFPDGRLNKDVVGRSCKEIGAMAGIDVPSSARIILLPAKGSGTEDVLAKEKLCPVVAILPYKTFQEAVAKAKANLLVEGAGHSAAVHSNNEANIRAAGLELPVSRLVVNQACSFTAGGSLTNGFAPTTTLGCGSWGGNSISENLDYKHLMNVSRIGKVIQGKKVPTDAEIWA